MIIVLKTIYGDTGGGIRGILIKCLVLWLTTLMFEKFCVFRVFFLSNGVIISALVLGDRSAVRHQITWLQSSHCSYLTSHSYFPSDEFHPNTTIIFHLVSSLYLECYTDTLRCCIKCCPTEVEVFCQRRVVISLSNILSVFKGQLMSLLKEIFPVLNGGESRKC